MKKTMACFLIWLLFLLPAGVWGQKMGYTNSINLLSDLPETKAANNQLKSLEVSLNSSLKEKEQALGQHYQDYLKLVELGITATQRQDNELALQREQQELEVLKQELRNQLETKKTSLYAPLLERVRRAIDQVAQENGYQLILDVAFMNLILDAHESMDITALVKAKLGM